MSRSTKKDDKERYLAYSITVRAADKAKEIEEEVVTKKMPKFIDGGPQDFLEWVYAFEQLAKLKHWNAEDKFLNATILLEGDLRDAFEDAAFSDDDVRMDEEFVRALRKASIVVLPVDYNEKLHEDLWASNMYCTIHRTSTHNTHDCRALRHGHQPEEHQQLDQKRGRNNSSGGQGPGGHRHGQTRVEQRRRRNDSSSDEEYMFVGINGQPNATTSPMRIGIKLEHGKEKYRALLDRGRATSQGSITVRFRIPQLKRDSVIIHDFEIIQTLRDDMVIGRDLMAALYLVVDFGDGIVRWDGSEVFTNNGEGAVRTSNARGLMEIPEEVVDELYAGEDTGVKPVDLLPDHLDAAIKHCYLKLLEQYYLL
ncbi:unnamed protein product [Phytophthora lilii]|uniref:Unnamed protein product n=1 Tax=Phytophthora lilii TaxID=2077276 RepID=A0A9W6UBE6_9STRA|nr:unnamed protein product [Phytophthora lilii]